MDQQSNSSPERTLVLGDSLIEFWPNRTTFCLSANRLSYISVGSEGRVDYTTFGTESKTQEYLSSLGSELSKLASTLQTAPDQSLALAILTAQNEVQRNKAKRDEDLLRRIKANFHTNYDQKLDYSPCKDDESYEYAFKRLEGLWPLLESPEYLEVRQTLAWTLRGTVEEADVDLMTDDAVILKMLEYLHTLYLQNHKEEKEGSDMDDSY
jgi:hypothetical protein